MSDKMTNNLSLINIPDSIDTALENLSDKPTKEIGSFIGDVFYRCLGGFSYKSDQMRILRKQCLIELESRIKQGIDRKSVV